MASSTFSSRQFLGALVIFAIVSQALVKADYDDPDSYPGKVFFSPSLYGRLVPVLIAHLHLHIYALFSK